MRALYIQSKASNIGLCWKWSWNYVHLQIYCLQSSYVDVVQLQFVLLVLVWNDEMTKVLLAYALIRWAEQVKMSYSYEWTSHLNEDEKKIQITRYSRCLEYISVRVCTWTLCRCNLSNMMICVFTSISGKLRVLPYPPLSNMADSLNSAHKKMTNSDQLKSRVQ